MASSPPTINAALFNRPRYGVNEAALTYGSQGLLNGINPDALPAGLLEDVVMPASGSQTPIVQQNLQPITRGGVTQYELPSSQVRFQGREGIGDIGVFDGMDYRLIDRKTGEVLTTNPQEAPALIAALNERDGKFSNWTVEQRPTGSTGEWSTANQQWAEAPSGLGVLADFALPVLGAALAPLTGGSSLLMSGLGAAGGSAASSLLQGRSLQDTLLRAALSGGTAAGIGALSQGIGSAAGSAAGAKAGSVAGSAAGGAGGAPFALLPGETLINVAAPAIGGLGGSALSGGIANIFGPLESGNMPTSAEEEILVTGARPSIDFIPAIAGAVPSVNPVPDETITVTAPRPSGAGIGLAAIPAAALAAALASGPSITPAMQDAAMNAGVESPRIDTQFPNSPETAGLGATATGGAGMGVADYLQAGLGGLSTIQGLSGLLGGSGGNTGIGDALNPNRGLVSYQPLNRRQIAPAFDPFTYGQTGGEFRFFTDATPQFQTGIGAGPAAMIAPENPNTPRFKDGGHARGIGGGQDDLIEARLSDGEYVIDAQTVSDLGDGSNDEGARRLNEMRELIRKRAGRKRVKTIAPPQKGVKSLLGAVK